MTNSAEAQLRRNSRHDSCGSAVHVSFLCKEFTNSSCSTSPVEQLFFGPSDLSVRPRTSDSETFDFIP